MKQLAQQRPKEKAEAGDGRPNRKEGHDRGKDLSANSHWCCGRPLRGCDHAHEVERIDIFHALDGMHADRADRHDHRHNDAGHNCPPRGGMETVTVMFGLGFCHAFNYLSPFFKYVNTLGRRVGFVLRRAFLEFFLKFYTLKMIICFLSI